MDIVIKSAAVAIIACVCILLIKSNNPGGAYALSICCAVMICIMGSSMLTETVAIIKTVIERSGLPYSIFLPVIKCVGIGIIVGMISGLCKDAGQNAVSSAVEFLGAAASVYIALPLISSVLNTLEELL